MQNTQQQKAAQFLKMHQDDGCFLMPNAWDAGSAKLLVSVGFEAIATTSAGIAFAAGKPDHGFVASDARLERDNMLDEVRKIAAAVSVPVNADLEGGFGDAPEAVAATIQQAIAAGAVGGNIEDYTGSQEQPLYDRTLAVERIKAARQLIDAGDIPFVLVARTDRLLIGQPDGMAEAIERANLYREAGADCLFVPGVSDPLSVAELAREINGPINVVMGLSGSDMTLSQLHDLGVRRVSIGGSLARALYHHMRVAAMEMRQQGTFTFAETQIPQAELNQLFESAL